ncbi:MAG: rod shape-determining protein MreC [Ruminococcus sp.]|nr:rod shape-determining protein MreC [Ruminococcus sp.]
MKDFFFSKTFKIILCLFALFIGIMLYTATQSGKDIGAEIFQTLFSPVQSASASISSAVREKLDMLTNARRYYEDNIQLRQKLDEMYNTMVDYEEIKKENEQLRNVIGLKEDYPDYEFSPPCAVISKTANDPFGSFIIDKGSSDGISAYDPVITDAGLVGVVTKVSSTYSRVTTILSPEVPVGVYCIRSGSSGVIEGDAAFAADGLCRMKYIDIDSDIQVGDIIVTSGNSGLFPSGRVVGTVKEIEVESSGLSFTATIEPIVDIPEVHSVFVITSFNGQGEGYEE